MDSSTAIILPESSTVNPNHHIGSDRPLRESFGKSRIGRKLFRKAVDAWAKATRRTNPISGPPIPNSEKHGGRRFYTLRQAQLGGYHSGDRRRANALPTWLEMYRLRCLGLSLRAIARQVGRHASTVYRVLLRYGRELQGITERAYRATHKAKTTPGLAMNKGVARTIVSIHPSSGISLTYAKIVLYTTGPLTPAQVKLCSGRMRAYRKSMEKAGRGDMAAQTEAYVRSIQGLGIVQGIRAINAYYGSRA